MRLRHAALAGALLLAGCESDSGYVPYVPAPGFKQNVQIWLDAPDLKQVETGRWITLHATRQAGPWMLRDSTVENPACEKLSPIEREFEAAGKVQWRVEPEGAAAYKWAADFQRQISFTAPGTYQVWAVSEGCGESFESNRVEVVVA